jgi:hypothetical protein
MSVTVLTPATDGRKDLPTAWLRGIIGETRTGRNRRVGRKARERLWLEWVLRWTQ